MLQGKDLGICSPSNWLNFNNLKCHFSIFQGFSLIKITEYPECLRTNFNSGKYRRNTVSPLPRLTNHSDPVPYDTFCSACVTLIPSLPVLDNSCSTRITMASKMTVQILWQTIGLVKDGDYKFSWSLIRNEGFFLHERIRQFTLWELNWSYGERKLEKAQLSLWMNHRANKRTQKSQFHGNFPFNSLKHF